VRKSVSVGATTASPRNKRIKVAATDDRPCASAGAGSVMKYIVAAMSSGAE
jgi:hypothetical protein